MYREELYRKGGLFSVTSKILVHDFLRELSVHIEVYAKHQAGLYRRSSSPDSSSFTLRSACIYPFGHPI